MPEHYFSFDPAGPARQRIIRVRLAGETHPVRIAAGVFAPDRVDKGTAVLLEHAPEPPAEGTFLDLGCGWGAIALTLGLRSPAATVWAVDVNARAVELTAANAAMLGLAGVHAVAPEQVPGDARFDLIWGNPPIRVGKAALHELLAYWLGRLAPGGEAYLVVQRNLGSDSLHRWLADSVTGVRVRRLTSVRGFRILQVHRPARR